jgi:hypothetical protein
MGKVGWVFVIFLGDTHPKNNENPPLSPIDRVVTRLKLNLGSSKNIIMVNEIMSIYIFYILFCSFSDKREKRRV